MRLRRGSQFPLTLGYCSVTLADASSTPRASARQVLLVCSATSVLSMSHCLAANQTSASLYKWHAPRVGRTPIRVTRLASTLTGSSLVSDRMTGVSRVRRSVRVRPRQSDGHLRRGLVDVHRFAIAAEGCRYANMSKAAWLGAPAGEIPYRYRAKDCRISRCVTLVALAPRLALARGPPSDCPVCSIL